MLDPPKAATNSRLLFCQSDATATSPPGVSRVMSDRFDDRDFFLETGFDLELVVQRHLNNRFAGNDVEGRVRVRNGPYDIHHAPGILFRQLLDPFVGVAHVLNLVGELRVEELRQILFTRPANRLETLTDGLNSGGFEAAILNREASDERIDLRQNPILEAQ